MRVLQRWLAVLAMVSIVACEYIPFSGGELEGTVAPAPADWSGVAHESVIQLETDPANPYSVKLWVVALGPALYVHAGANQTTWVDNIETSPNVRILIGDKIYELRAEQVEDAAVFEQFSAVYETKYGTRPRNENIAEVYLYRLAPRS
jgi:hypothetical protein